MISQVVKAVGTFREVVSRDTDNIDDIFGSAVYTLEAELTGIVRG